MTQAALCRWLWWEAEPSPTGASSFRYAKGRRELSSLLFSEALGLRAFNGALATVSQVETEREATR